MRQKQDQVAKAMVASCALSIGWLHVTRCLICRSSSESTAVSQRPGCIAGTGRQRRRARRRRARMPRCAGARAMRRRRCSAARRGRARPRTQRGTARQRPRRTPAARPLRPGSARSACAWCAAGAGCAAAWPMASISAAALQCWHVPSLGLCASSICCASMSVLLWPSINVHFPAFTFFKCKNKICVYKCPRVLVKLQNRSGSDRACMLGRGTASVGRARQRWMRTRSTPSCATRASGTARALLCATCGAATKRTLVRHASLPV